jgi:hypothetical protein
MNVRDERKPRFLGPRANAPLSVINGYASKRPSNGRRWGIICPILAAARRPRAARNPCFLGKLCGAALVRPRNARDNINESAEILITEALSGPCFAVFYKTE